MRKQKQEKDSFTMHDWYELIQTANKEINNYYTDSTMPKDSFTILHYMEQFNSTFEDSYNEIRKLIRYGKVEKTGWYKRESDRNKYRLYKALKNRE